MNQNRTHLLALGICVAALLVPNIAGAQNDFSAHYNRFLYHQIGNGARSAAMGGAYSALQGGDQALLGNPASLGFLQDPYAMIDFGISEVSSHTTMDGGPFAPPVAARADTEAEMWNIGGGVAYPFEWGGLGLFYQHSEDDIDSEAYRFSNNSLEMSGDLDRNAVSVGGGYRVNDMWAVGYRYTYLNWDSDSTVNVVRPLPAYEFASVGEETDSHLSHLGAQYVASEDLVFGIDGSFGFGDRDFTGGGDADADSWSVRGGVAWSAFENIPLLLALDLSFENYELDGGGSDVDEDIFGLHLGAEYEVSENFFLRAGYQFEDFDYEDGAAGISEDPSIGGYSAGFGYSFDQFTVDYGFVYNDTGNGGDMTHVIGVGFRF